jgi:hypothetical protein
MYPCTEADAWHCCQRKRDYKDIFLCPVPVLELLALIAFGACKAL